VLPLHHHGLVIGTECSKHMKVGCRGGHKGKPDVVRESHPGTVQVWLVGGEADACLLQQNQQQIQPHTLKIARVDTVEVRNVPVRREAFKTVFFLGDGASTARTTGIRSVYALWRQTLEPENNYH
jgi:hypothetical protein